MVGIPNSKDVKLSGNTVMGNKTIQTIEVPNMIRRSSMMQHYSSNKNKKDTPYSKVRKSKEVTDYFDFSTIRHKYFDHIEQATKV